MRKAFREKLAVHSLCIPHLFLVRKCSFLELKFESARTRHNNNAFVSHTLDSWDENSNSSSRTLYKHQFHSGFFRYRVFSKDSHSIIRWVRVFILKFYIFLKMKVHACICCRFAYMHILTKPYLYYKAAAVCWNFYIAFFFFRKSSRLAVLGARPCITTNQLVFSCISFLNTAQWVSIPLWLCPPHGSSKFQREWVLWSSAIMVRNFDYVKIQAIISHLLFHPTWQRHLLQNKWKYRNSLNIQLFSKTKKLLKEIHEILTCIRNLDRVNCCEQINCSKALF